jgi:hypothetical protein
LVDVRLLGKATALRRSQMSALTGSVVVNAWVKLPRLAQKASHEKMAAVTTAMEAVAGALLIGAAMSLFWAATGWWAGLPDFD